MDPKDKITTLKFSNASVVTCLLFIVLVLVGFVFLFQSCAVAIIKAAKG